MESPILRKGLHFSYRPLGRAAPALVVNLGGGDMPVAEEIPNLPDVDAGVKEQGSSRGPERMRRVDTARGFGGIRIFVLLDGPRQLLKIALY